ncbi:MAG: YjbQ family protein [Firmicutes bacterium]|nr:YjbQ family protein [Bacillota bacterium]
MIEHIRIDSRSQNEFIELTQDLNRLVAECGVREGVCFVTVPHTTAGITVNENDDPTVRADMDATLSRIVPYLADYQHAEGNSAAHIKASLVGSSVTLLIRDGQLLLGRWQGVFFCEFDGPRLRDVYVRIVGL